MRDKEREAQLRRDQLCASCPTMRLCPDYVERFAVPGPVEVKAIATLRVDMTGDVPPEAEWLALGGLLS